EGSAGGVAELKGDGIVTGRFLIPHADGGFEGLPGQVVVESAQGATGRRKRRNRSVVERRRFVRERPAIIRTPRSIAIHLETVERRVVDEVVRHGHCI